MSELRGVVYITKSRGQ